MVLLLALASAPAWAQEAPGTTTSADVALTPPPPPPPDEARVKSTADLEPPPPPPVNDPGDLQSPPLAPPAAPLRPVSAVGPGVRVFASALGSLVGGATIGYAGALLGDTLSPPDAVARLLGLGLGYTLGAFVGSAVGALGGGMLAGGGDVAWGAFLGSGIGTAAMLLLVVPAMLLGPIGAVVLLLPMIGAFLGYDRTQGLGAPWLRPVMAAAGGSNNDEARALVAVDQALGLSCSRG